MEENEVEDDVGSSVEKGMRSAVILGLSVKVAVHGGERVSVELGG